MNAAAQRIAAATNPGEAAAALYEWEASMVRFAATDEGRTQIERMLDTARMQGDFDKRSRLGDIMAAGEQLRYTLERNESIAALAAEFTAHRGDAPPPTLRSADAIGHGSGLDPMHMDALRRVAEDYADYARDGNVASEKKYDALLDADAALVEPSSNDVTLAGAVRLFGNERGRFSSDELDAESVVGREAITAQAWRAVNHPNAGPETFSAAASIVGTDLILNPKCPPEVAARVLSAQPLTVPVDPAVWEAVRSRSHASPAYAHLAAQRHPDPVERDAAWLALTSARWDNSTEADYMAVREMFRPGGRNTIPEKYASAIVENLVNQERAGILPRGLDTYVGVGSEFRAFKNSLQDVQEEPKLVRRRLFG